MAPARISDWTNRLIFRFRRWNRPLRKELEDAGTPIGANDLLIAATAVANRLVLVTHNVSEFKRVPNLQWEDWDA